MVEITEREEVLLGIIRAQFSVINFMVSFTTNFAELAEWARDETMKLNESVFPFLKEKIHTLNTDFGMDLTTTDVVKKEEAKVE